MKNGWIQRSLRDVTTKIGSGATPKGGQASYIQSGVSLIRSLNVHDTEFRTKDLAFIDDAQSKQLDNVIVEAGDVLLNITGASIARCCVVPEEVLPARLNQHVTILRPDPKHLLPSFLQYMLVSRDYKARLLGAGEAGATRQALTKGLLQEFYIKFPPLIPEQRRIVAILDEAFAAIATAKQNAEQNLQNARKLFESHLNAVFSQRGEGWILKPVGDIAQKSLGKMLDRQKNKGEFKPYLRNLNVRWFTFDLSDLIEMRFLAEEADKYTAVKGDVLVCEGGYPGRAAIWDDDEPIHFQKAIHRVRFHEPEHNKWFVYYLFANDSSGELQKHFTGAGIQHFTGKVLGRFEVPIPPRTQIRKLVAQIDDLHTEIKSLESIYQRKFAALDELKKSLLHQAFSGELTNGHAGCNGKLVKASS